MIVIVKIGNFQKILFHPNNKTVLIFVLIWVIVLRTKKYSSSIYY